MTVDVVVIPIQFGSVPLVCVCIRERGGERERGRERESEGGGGGGGGRERERSILIAHQYIVSSLSFVLRSNWRW